MARRARAARRAPEPEVGSGGVHRRKRPTPPLPEVVRAQRVPDTRSRLLSSLAPPAAERPGARPSAPPDTRTRLARPPEERPAVPAEARVAPPGPARPEPSPAAPTPVGARPPAAADGTPEPRPPAAVPAPAAGPGPAAEIAGAGAVTPPPAGLVGPPVPVEEETAAASGGRGGPGGARSAGDAAPRAAAPESGAAPALGAGAEAGARAVGGAGGVRVEPLLAEAPESLGPAAQERLASAQSGFAANATEAAALPSADTSVAGAQASVTVPAAQAQAEAQGALVAELGARPAPSPEIEELCQRIYDAIHSRQPPDEDSLVAADPEAAAAAAGAELNSTVEGDTQRVAGEYGSLDEGAEGEVPPEGVAVVAPSTEVVGPEVGAAGAAPDALTADDVSLEADVEASAARIEEAGMDSPTAQLVQEGPIADARAAQGELAESAAEDPQAVLAAQDEAIATAQADMGALQAQALAALTTSRTSAVNTTTAGQGALAGGDEQRRQSAADEAQSIFSSTQTQVRSLLEPLPRTAMQRWETGLPRLTSDFRAHLDRVQRWIDERHEGVGGSLLSLWDSVAGLPDEIVEEYNDAEQTFGDDVCELIRSISVEVNTVVETCQRLIEDARTRIDAIFAALPANLQSWAEEQRTGFASQLDGLAAEATAARDDFNQQLVDRAAHAVQEVREEVHALREAAGGLLGRIADAITAFLDDPVRAIINGLLSLVGISPPAFWQVVDRLGEVVSAIADDPLSFANNLLEAVSQGFTRFFDNIGTHLLQGLLDWLFGSLGSVGVQIPRDLSLPSIITFFLQLMGLTWPNIREILGRHIGPENVDLIEQAWDLLSTLISQGPEGLFEMLREQLDPAALFQAVMEAAIEFVVETLITQVSMRLIAMLNPAGAVLQAVEAIYKVLKWIFENATRIFTLVETIVNGAWDLVNGNISGMAAAVEAGLARIIPPVIDFFAGLIGLGDLPEKVAELIGSLQERVLEVADRVIGGIVRQARRLLQSIGLGGAEHADAPPEEGDGELGQHIGFNVEGESHTLWIEGEGGSARIMVASGTPTGLDARLAEWSGRLDTLAEADRGRARALLQTVADYIGVTLQLAHAEETAEAQPGGAGTQAANETVAAERTLSENVAELWGLFGGGPTGEGVVVGTYGDLSGTRPDHQAHHVPPKLLMRWIGEQAADATRSLEEAEQAELGPGSALAQFRALRDLASQEYATDGMGLAAISLHEETHIRRANDPGSDEWRAHWGRRTAEIVEQALRRKSMKDQEISPIRRTSIESLSDADIVILADQLHEESGRSFAPAGRTHPLAEAELSLTQIQALRVRLAPVVASGDYGNRGAASTQFYGSELDAAAEPLPPLPGTPEFLDVVRPVARSAALQAHLAVEVAVTNSVKDGDPSENAERLQELRTTIGPNTWNPIHHLIARLGMF